jgi:hypothetical protein
VYKNTSKILAIFLYPMVLLLDPRFLQKPQDASLKLAAALPRDNLHQGYTFRDGFTDDALQFRVNLAALVENVVEIEYELGHSLCET